MTDNQSSTNTAADLRRRAEERLREKADRSPQDLASQSPEEILKILHELRVQQIELEMQNEELQRTQFELKTARERYFNLYDLAPVGYVTLSEQGLILEANLTATGLLGVARGTLVKQPFSRFMLKEDQDIYYLHRKQLFENGEPQGYDLRMVKKDGTPFWAHLAATTAPDGEGTRLCSAVIIDITKRKRAEEAITLATQKTIDILESITDAFFALDENLVTTYFNTAAERLLNRNRMDVIGRNLLEAFPEAKGSVFEEKYTRAIHDKKMLSFETYFGVKPYENWYEVRVYPQQNGISVFFQVVTERKQAEEALRESKEDALRSEARLKKAQTVARVGDWSWNIKDGQVEWSDEMYTIFGIDKNSYTGRLGDVIAQMIHPDDLHLVLPSNTATFADKKPVEYRIIWSDGSIRHIWAESGAAILDEAGNPAYLTGIAQDITDRVEAERVLAKSEEQFRTLASLAQVGIYLSKPDGSCLYTNPTWQKMAGMSSEETLGQGWVNGIHPDDREMVLSNWQKMVDSQGEWGLEYRFLNHEGKTTIVFGLATAQKDASGNIVGYIGVNIDITERKQAETFSKNLVTMNPVSIQVLDTQGFTLEVNPAFKLLFGSVPPADYSIFNDPQLAQQGIGKIFDQLRNSEVVHLPDVSFNPHDSIPALPDVPNWVRTIGFPICSENEKPERFVLMQENITERKIAEETLRESEFKFRQTFDVSPVGIVMVGLDTRFIQCNLVFAQSLGYEAEELVGKLIEDVTLPEDNHIGKAEMVAVLKGEITKSQVQKRYLRKDGKVIWGEVTITLIRDTNGHAQYFLAIIQNITERKLAEQKINEQLAELHRWNNATLGREDRIMELKREVNKLLAEAGKPPHYASVAELQGSRGE